MATNASSLPAPKSGFMTVQFWVGLLAVVVTFVLGSVGVQIPGQAQTWLNSLPSWAVPGVIGVKPLEPTFRSIFVYRFGNALPYEFMGVRRPQHTKDAEAADRELRPQGMPS